jgi:hypothetical protein
MSDVDPTQLLQPAATRVRDPLSGRSVWLAGMIRNPRKKGETDLVYDLWFEAEHGVDDRQAIQSAIAANLEGLGFRGKVYAMPAGSPPRRPGVAGGAPPSGAAPGGTPRPGTAPPTRTPTAPPTRTPRARRTPSRA